MASGHVEVYFTVLLAEVPGDARVFFVIIFISSPSLCFPFSLRRMFFSKSVVDSVLLCGKNETITIE